MRLERSGVGRGDEMMGGCVRDAGDGGVGGWEGGCEVKEWMLKSGFHVSREEG